MLLCCMAATLMLACSNDKSGGHDGDEGVETEVNGTQLDGNTTLYGLVTDRPSRRPAARAPSCCGTIPATPTGKATSIPSTNA